MTDSLEKSAEGQMVDLVFVDVAFNGKSRYKVESTGQILEGRVKIVDVYQEPENVNITSFGEFMPPSPEVNGRFRGINAETGRRYWGYCIIE